MKLGLITYWYRKMFFFRTFTSMLVVHLNNKKKTKDDNYTIEGALVGSPEELDELLKSAVLWHMQRRGFQATSNACMSVMLPEIMEQARFAHPVKTGN